MLIKKGKFLYYFLENEEVTFEIIDWITPFGIEKFGKKEIINIIIPNTNEGKNVINLLSQISDEIKSEFNEFAKIPIKNNLLRCEFIQNTCVEKNDKVSGLLKFKIYNFRGNWGIISLLSD